MRNRYQPPPETIVDARVPTNDFEGWEDALKRPVKRKSKWRKESEAGATEDEIQTFFNTQLLKLIKQAYLKGLSVEDCLSTIISETSDGVYVPISKQVRKEFLEKIRMGYSQFDEVANEQSEGK